jgi:hypothetical protein
MLSMSWELLLCVVVTGLVLHLCCSGETLALGNFRHFLLDLVAFAGTGLDSLGAMCMFAALPCVCCTICTSGNTAPFLHQLLILFKPPAYCIVTRTGHHARRDQKSKSTS